MSNKWLKACSVLPALLITPALADTVTEPTENFNGNHYFVSNGSTLTLGKSDVNSVDGVYSDWYHAVAGGVVQNNLGSVVVEDETIFSNNASYIRTEEQDANLSKSDGSEMGGAIYAQGDSTEYATTEIGNNVEFNGNIASAGGAIFLYGGNVVNFGDNVKFSGNKGTWNLPEDSFKGPSATGTGYGGAIASTKADVQEDPNKLGPDNGNAILTFKGKSTFEDNVADRQGGAISLYGSQATFNGDALFTGNTALAPSEGNVKGGGAISATDSEFVFNEGAAFANNSATGAGGAIWNGVFEGSSSMTFNGSASFENNSANNGGAIYNEGTLKLADSDFTYNKAASTSGDSRGGAIYNEGDLTLNTANIYGNKAQISEEGKGKGWGGAIYNTGTLNFNAKSGMSASDRVYVKGNTATHVGGAIYNEGTLNFNNVTDDEIVQITFGGNSADYGGGAIYNKGDINTLSRVLFQGNSGGIGAAVLNSTDGTIGSIKNSTFAYNTAQTTGGAVHNKGTIETVENVLFQGNRSNNGGAFWNGGGGEVQFENVDFISNGAVITNAVEKNNNLQGGAISNSGTISYINNSTFVGNQAGKQGGAIANALSGGKGTVVLKDVLMDSNVAGDAGGAIYNHDGIVTLSGNNTFVNNFAGGVANDIHNLGTLNIKGGVTTMTGGITGDGGVLTISGGAILDIGTASIQQSSIKFDGEGGKLFASLLNEDYYSKLLVDSIDGNADITLKIGSVGEYDVFGKDGVTGITFNHGNLFNVTTSDDNKVIVTTKDVATVAKDNGLANESAAVLVGLANSGNNAMNAMAIRAQDALKEQGGAQYVQAEAKKLLPQDTPVAQSVASSAQSQVLSLAAGRMSGNALVGRSGGDAANMDYGVWAQGLMNHSKYADKFSGDTYGVAVGADALINGKYTVGIGYAYNETDIDATHDMSIDSSSLFVYGQYKPTQWYINAALNYTMANYTESDVAFGVASGYEYDVDSFGGQIMTGYDFASGLTPEVGARYLHIATDDYNNGFNVENEDTNYLTGVAGLKYAFEIESDARLKFRPEIRAAATYDFLSDEAVTTVTIPGASAYVLNGERLSRFGGEFGIGLSALYEGWEISVNYDLDLHEDYTSQTGMLKFRYNF